MVVILGHLKSCCINLSALHMNIFPAVLGSLGSVRTSSRSQYREPTARMQVSNKGLKYRPPLAILSRKIVSFTIWNHGCSHSKYKSIKCAWSSSDKQVSSGGGSSPATSYRQVASGNSRHSGVLVEHPVHDGSVEYVSSTGESICQYQLSIG